jgi:hypothetical protein
MHFSNSNCQFIINKQYHSVELYFGEILYIVNIFLKLKKELLEWLQILEWEIPAMNCLKNCKFCPFLLNTFFLLIFVVKNRELFKLNSDIHHIETRHNNDFHMPSTQLNLFQEGVFYSGIKMYNHLPLSIKDLSHDIKWFKWALKGFVQSNSFYSLKEYFNLENECCLVLIHHIT